jgi:hypothetical protein
MAEETQETTAPVEEAPLEEVLPEPVPETTALVNPDKAEKRAQDDRQRMQLALMAQASLALDQTNDLSKLIQWGKVLAASGMFNDVRGPAQAIVKVLYGRELGLTPMQSLTGIYFFSGKLVLSAGTMAGIIKASGRYDYSVQKHTANCCVLEFYRLWTVPGQVRPDRELLGVSEFSMNDAITAGIVKGTNWKNYPRNMLFARAMSNGFKWYCQDLAQGGAYVAGEIQGDGTPIDAEFIADPQ